MYWHVKSAKWVDIVNDFDDFTCFVTEIRKPKTDLFKAAKSDLYTKEQYFAGVFWGKIRGSIHRDILIKIHEWSGWWYGYKELSDQLHIDIKNLKKEIKVLKEQGFLERVPIYNEVNGLLAGSGYVLTKKALLSSSITAREAKVGISRSPILSVIIILFLFFNSYIPVSVDIHDGDSKYYFREMVETRLQYIEQQSFDYDLFVEYMQLLGLNNREVILRQAVLETGSFTSIIFNENNNLFGMKRPRVRPNTVVGENRGHAVYQHWTCSVRDYKLWYEYVTASKKYDDYYSFLYTIGYAEDMEYINKLKGLAI